MSWWFSPWYDGFMRRSEEESLGRWRSELLSDVEGEVLDLGAGTGANVPYWPKGVAHVVAAEPDAGMARRLRERVRMSPHAAARIEVVQTPAERLPFGDEAFDVVVSTLVLCTVDDLDRSIVEARRVLRPGGRLVFIEHVASEKSALRLLGQRIAEPFWTPLAGGCRLTRRSHEAMEHAGFRLESLTRESMRGAMPVVRETVRGTARKP